MAKHSDTGTKTFSSLSMLIWLDISHNLIESLQRGTFWGLTYMKKLDISSNPLSYLNDDAFEGTLSLHRLSLSNCTSLLWLSSSVVGTLRSVEVLDMSESNVVPLQLQTLREVPIGTLNLTGSRLSSHNLEFLKSTLHLQRLVSDQRGLCCHTVVTGVCIGSPGYKCLSLFSKAGWLFCFVISIIIAVTNIITFVYNIRVSANVDLVVTGNLAIANLIMLLPILVLLIWGMNYEQLFLFYDSFLAEEEI